jgi:ammonium transporter, Amt family
MRKKIFLTVAIIVTLFNGSLLCAETGVSDEMFRVNNTWMLIATFLVFIMHLGFATLETGLTQAKNTVNILFKNTGIVAIGLLTYALIGFNLMYPGNAWKIGHVLGVGGFGLFAPIGTAGLIEYANGAYTYWTDFLFQGMFAATAATIVSGAVAERIKLNSFLIFSAFYVALVYPVIGSWGWGGGWLNSLGFHDFAGSTFVHSVGGWAALIGVIMVGPRTGKYVNGKIFSIMGHSMPLATIGVFLLWLGWFGFNGGSVLSADPELLSFVCVSTTLAGAAGIIGAMIMSWSIQKKPDLSMILNGALAGLVGITAGADAVSISSAIIIGFVSGIIVVFAVFMFDHLRLDDPVGALSVHLVCGIWGTLAVGIFCKQYSLGIQLLGITVIGAACCISSAVIFFIVKCMIGLRVSREEEIRGLDIGEHGMEAYNGFQIFTNQ